MTFIAALVALLIERFFDWSHLRHWHWFHLYQRKVAERLPNKQVYLLLAATILPILLLTWLISWLLLGALYGFASLVFQLLILLYCLGPQNLWADAFACINALSQGDLATASEKLKTLFGITDRLDPQGLHKQLLSDIFIQANQRVFAVVFWFVIFGPMGALMYRTIAVSADIASREVSPDLPQQAHLIQTYLDWLPVRVFTFLFALGGHFAQVLTCWRKKAIYGVSENDALLTQCGRAALSTEPAGAVGNDGAAEKDAINLLDRVFVMVLVIILVLSILGW